MSQSRRPNSQQKSIAQSINNLKTQLQQQRQHRWSQSKVNQELFDFLTLNNLQQHYNKIAQYCDGSLQQLSTGSIKEIKDLPIGHQLKLQKALEKLPKKEEKIESKFMEQILQNDQKECCWICFQLIFQGIDCYGKKLCSEKCRQNYLKEIQINCKRCGKLKPKYEAKNSYGEWYCDENCVYSVEELMMLLMKQSQLKM